MQANTDHRIKLPITKPVFDQEELDMIANALKSGWVVQGPNVCHFETAFAQFCGIQHAVATTSCTTALHLGLIALGVQPGDEIILPSFTYIATANAVEYCGAKPVFCDVDLTSFTLDPHDIAHRITEKTKGIIPVSLFGYPLDYSWLNRLAEEHDLWILEDAACAMGAQRNNKHAGTESHAAAFSFHPRKAITTGEGGMLVTNNDDIVQKVKCLRDHGASKSDHQRHIENGGSLLPDFDVLGYNYRMTDIQGAMGCAQIKKAPRILEQRRQLADLYNNQLASLDWICTPEKNHDTNHAYQSYVVLLSNPQNTLPTLDTLETLNIKRNRLFQQLESIGISVRQGTHAVHTLGYYRNKYNLQETDYPQSLLADRLSLTLPLFYDMEWDDVLYVVERLKEYGNP